jgi:hypothetical protein
MDGSEDADVRPKKKKRPAAHGYRALFVFEFF